MGLASRDIAGGNAVTRDFGSLGGLARADWKQFSSEERERIVGWLSEERAAGKNSVREINVALILGCSLGGIYRPDGRLGEVEDKKTGEDLLEDEVGLLRMKMDEANSVFQTAEGSLDPPTHGVEAFQGGGRETLRIQVGNEKFSMAVFYFNPDDSERKNSKTGTFQF